MKKGVFSATIILLLIASEAFSMESINLRQSGQKQKYYKEKILAPLSNLNITNLQEKHIILDDENDLRSLKINHNKKLSSIRFQQYHKSIPIWRQHIIISFKEGKFQRLKGTLFTDLKIDTSVFFTESEVLESAKNNLKSLSGEENWHYSNESVKLVIFVNDNHIPFTAYFVNFFAESANREPTRPHLIINAQTNEILKQWEGLTY